MLKRIALLLSVFCLLSASFSSCGYEVIVRKKGEQESTTESGSTVPRTTAPQATAAAASSSPAENTSVPPSFSVDTSFKPLPLPVEEVIELYTRAVNDVKLYSPGYRRNEYQDITNVKAGENGLQLFSRILNLVGTELLRSSGDADASVTVPAHDDRAVRRTFPIYDKEVGCELKDMSIVQSAVCYTDGNTYKIVITFNDQLNPDPFTSEFGKIMTPIDRNKFSAPIKEYLVVLDMDSYKLDINYTGCEIVCMIDKKSARLTSLTQKMIMDIDFDMNLDLIIFKTNNIKATGAVINRLEYSNFDWS